MNAGLSEVSCGTISINEFESKAKDLERTLTEASNISEVERQHCVLDELRAMLNQGAESWPKYDILRAQRILQSSEVAYDASRNRLAPRQKFRFRTSTHERTTGSTSNCTDLSMAAPETAKKDIGGINSTDLSHHAGLGETLLEVSQPIGETAGCFPTIIYREGILGRAVLMRGKGCEMKVVLEHGSRSVRIIGLSRCVIETGVVDGSVWISDCTHCLFRTRCRQLRVHSSSRCRFFVETVGSPIIEKCAELAFGSFCKDRQTAVTSSNRISVVDMSSLGEDGSCNWNHASPGDDEDNWVCRQR